MGQVCIWVELPIQRRLCSIFVRNVGSPDIHECFRGLTGSQRTPGFWGVRAGLVKELSIYQGGVQLHCDSQNVVFLAKNHVYNARIKHIDVRFHKNRELVSSGELLFEKIHTSKNAVDMLTKPITMEKFKHYLNLINISICYMGDAPTHCLR